MSRPIILAALIIIAVSAFLIIRRSHNAPGYPADATTLAHGHRLFTRYCTSCHGLQEDGIGPRLGGITSLLTEDQLVTFIRNPEKSIASGNARAVALHSRYKQTMPAFDWMAADSLHSILAYLKDRTGHFDIKPLVVDVPAVHAGGMSGTLVATPRKSGLKIELQDVIKLPRLPYSTPELGIATMRPHPSGDGRLFVSDQGGIMYVISHGKAEVYLDMRKLIKDFHIGPGIATGLGSFDFHPDFLHNGLLYITHAEKFHGQRADYSVTDSARSEVQWVLAEWKVDDVNANKFSGTHRELLRLHAPTYGHGAQDLQFIPGLDKGDPDYGLLYWGYGDGGSNNLHRPELGHNLRSFLGTIMRLDPRGHNSRNGQYGIPPDNPFAQEKDPDVVREIWAYGFRNPHRMAWDVAHGKRMLTTDIGESNVEELNIIEKGGDYGWPNCEGNFRIYTREDLKTVYPLARADEGLYKRPFAVYDHTAGNAISGGFVYDGTIEALRGKYIFGDVVNGKLFYVNLGSDLSDSTVYELTVIRDGKETSLRELSHEKRMHLRIAYDRFSKEMYVMTKVDGMIRRIVKAY
jgi:glucose/arabinose dehydrogenase/mono/diheme cytochrome c family protein